MKPKKNAKLTWSPDGGDAFYYALTNGYIKISDIVTPVNKLKVVKALNIIQDFEELVLDLADEGVRGTDEN